MVCSLADMHTGKFSDAWHHVTPTHIPGKLQHFCKSKMNILPNMLRTNSNSPLPHPYKWLWNWTAICNIYEKQVRWIQKNPKKILKGDYRIKKQPFPVTPLLPLHHNTAGGCYCSSCRPLSYQAARQMEITKLLFKSYSLPSSLL